MSNVRLRPRWGVLGGLALASLVVPPGLLMLVTADRLPERLFLVEILGEGLAHSAAPPGSPGTPCGARACSRANAA